MPASLHYVIQHWLKALSLEVQYVPDANPLVVSSNSITTMITRKRQISSGRIPNQMVRKRQTRSATARSAYSFKLVMMFTIKIDEHHYMPLAVTVNR